MLIKFAKNIVSEKEFFVQSRIQRSIACQEASRQGAKLYAIFYMEPTFTSNFGYILVYIYIYYVKLIFVLFNVIPPFKMF